MSITTRNIKQKLGLTASPAEINQLCDLSSKFVAAGSTLTLTAAAHNGKTIKLDTATGSVVTLPPATGSGAVYKFIVSVLATSNSHKIQTSATTQHLQGYALIVDTDTADNTEGFFAVSGTSDTITLNRSTTGSVKLGETITITDVASTLHAVEAVLSGTGDLATPFSAAVS
jgi:hypothetical protein